jgi:signal peptidase II
MISRTARFSISTAIFALDRLTKYWIEQSLDSWTTIPVVPGVFNIIHAQNRGAAFGVMNQSEGPLRTFLLVGVSFAVMLFVALQLWRLPKGGWPPGNLVPGALSMVLGGAAGNLYDRILKGSVTDFLQVFIGHYEWPSFNVADSAITVGAGLLMISLWNTRRPN